MSRYQQWQDLLLQARSAPEVEAIVAQCRDSLAAGDKVGWPGAARAALFEKDLRIAGLMLEREQALVQSDPESGATLQEVSALYKTAVQRLREIER